MTTRCVITQKSVVLICSVAESCNHALRFVCSVTLLQLQCYNKTTWHSSKHTKWQPSESFTVLPTASS